MPARSNPHMHALVCRPPHQQQQRQPQNPPCSKSASWPPGTPCQAPGVPSKTASARPRQGANEPKLPTSTVHHNHTGPCKASAGAHTAAAWPGWLCVQCCNNNDNDDGDAAPGRLCTCACVRACDAAHKGSGTRARKTLRRRECGCKTSQLSLREQHPSVQRKDQTKDQNKQNTSYPTRKAGTGTAANAHWQQQKQPHPVTPVCM